MTRSPKTRYIDLTTRLIILTWVATFMGSFIYQYNDAHHDAIGFAVAEAQAVFERDVVLHRWASRHGGVLVPAIPQGQLFVPAQRETSNAKLELLNPSEVIRQTHSPTLQRSGPMGRVVSLTPLVPDNKPDPWEEKALEVFESSQDPVPRALHAVVQDGNHTVMRYIQPIVVGPSCIQCHENQGLQVGANHGALSVSLSMVPFEKPVRNRIISSAIFHLLLGSLGLIGIVWSARRFRRHALLQEQNEQRFRLFYENAPIAYQALDSNGRILEVNGGWLNLFGYVRSEVVGCPLSSLVEPSQVDAFGSWLSTCRNSGQIGFVELRLRTKLGVYIDVSLQSCAWQSFDAASSEIHSVVRGRPAGSTAGVAEADSI